MTIAAGHAFLILLRGAFPVNVLNAIKMVPEVCTIYCATANPVEVILAESEQGRGILGVIDGNRSRGIEDDILPTLRELGIGVTAYGVLSRGILSGRVPDASVKGDIRVMRMPRYAQGNLEKNLGLVATLAAIGKAKGATPAQLAIAWARSRGSDIVPVIGARRRMQLDESLGALALSLTAGELARIDAAVSPALTSGERYDPTQMAHLDSEAQH